MNFFQPAPHPTAERPTPSPRELHRVAGASLVGTAVEFYDFFICGTAAALVFGRVFFPALGTAAGTIAAFATFSVAFVRVPSGRSCSATSATGSGARSRSSTRF